MTDTQIQSLLEQLKNLPVLKESMVPVEWGDLNQQIIKLLLQQAWMMGFQDGIKDARRDKQ